MPTLRTLTLAALATLALAKTDMEGCTSSATVAYGGASMIFWVPDTGEICSFLDCGGGRAPPKTTVPGCGNYVGTATYTPDYMPGWGADATPTPTLTPGVSSGFSQNTVTEAESASSAASAVVTSMVTSVAATTAGTTVVAGNTETVEVSSPVASGTGNAGPGGNGTATFTTGKPAQATGAASGMYAVGQGVLGLAGVVAGLAML